MNIYVVIIGIIVLILIYLIILLKNTKKESEKIIISLIEKNNDAKQDIIKFLYENRESLYKNINEFKDKINEKMENELKEGFEINNNNMKELIERVAKIDSAQNNIQKLSTEIIGLQKILSDKKSRGLFGELKLEQVLDYVYGDNSLYQRQYKLSNSKIADAVIYINAKQKLLAIDSKFPLENYLNYINSNGSDGKREFMKNLKKHIDDIADKYIIEGETVEYAMMFLPSESIFLDVCKNFEEILEYSYRKKVWITSQTNLIIYISTIQFATLEYIKNKNSEEILSRLIKFSDEFKRYDERFEKLKKDFNNLEKDFREISITSEKIIKTFDLIKNINNNEME